MKTTTFVLGSAALALAVFGETRATGDVIANQTFSDGFGAWTQVVSSGSFVIQDIGAPHGNVAAGRGTVGNTPPPLPKGSINGSLDYALASGTGTTALSISTDFQWNLGNDFAKAWVGLGTATPNQGFVLQIMDTTGFGGYNVALFKENGVNIALANADMTVYNGWHTLRLDWIKGVAGTPTESQMKIYFDGGLLTTTQDGSYTNFTHVYAGAYSGSAGVKTVLLDNIVVTGMPVPEPAALSLLALGGVALLRRRRR